MQSVGRSQDGCAAYISADPGCAASTVSLAAVNGTNTKWLLSSIGTTGKFAIAMHVSVWWWVGGRAGGRAPWCLA